jgi:hypothetical protein
MVEYPRWTASSFSRPRRLLLAVVGVGAAAFVFWLVIILAPRLLVPSVSTESLSDVDDRAKRHELQDNRLKLQNDARTTLLQALAGGVLLLGAYFTYRQLQVTREGQITDRYSKAVDQLGEASEDKVDVRLGGIYALERIANDSPKDQAQVAEVLSAFVRGHAPWPPTRDKQPPADEPLEPPRPCRRGTRRSGCPDGARPL